MTKKQQQIILAAVLTGVLVFLWIPKGAFQRGKSGGRGAAGRVSAVPAFEPDMGEIQNFLGSLAREKQLEDTVREVWQKPWPHDPFVRQMRPSTKNIKLTGIVWDELMPIAIVNGETFKVGESIEGYEIVRIKSSSVIFRCGSETFELQLFETREASRAKEPKPAKPL